LLEVDEEIRNNFKKLVDDFMKDLFEISDFDPNNENFSQIKSSI
jgi:hypothetical protein